MSTPQAPRRNPSRETKASRATKSASSPRERRPSRSIAASSTHASTAHSRRASHSQPHPQSQSQAQVGRSPRHSVSHPSRASRSHGSRSTRASSPHTHAHSRAASGSRVSSAGHHHHHHHHHHHGSRGGSSSAPSHVPSHVGSSTQAARSPGSTTRTSRDRSLHAASAARERSALCRYMERYGAMQPLRMALLQLYDNRPTKGIAMVQLRASLGDNRPNMQEWQLMKRQVNDSLAQIASLKAEGERLRRKLDIMTRGVLPSLNLGRTAYR